MQKALKHRVRSRQHLQVALALRTAGASYAAIGKGLGLSKTRAYQLVMAGLDDLEASVKEAAEKLRALEVLRCDQLTMKLWPNSANPRVTDSILRVMERRAKLLGLDAPQKIAETNAAGDDIAARAAAVRAKLLG